MSLDFNPLDILRGTSSQVINKKYSHDDENYQGSIIDSDSKDHDSQIYQMAEDKADKIGGLTAISVMLNDFSELSNKLVKLNNYNIVSCLTLDDMEDYGIFQKIFNGKNSDNIFKTEEARDSLTAGFRTKTIIDGGLFAKDIEFVNGDVSYAQAAHYKDAPRNRLTQQDVFQQEIYANGGIMYTNGNCDMYEAALNFAKADINAIEVAHAVAEGYDPTMNFYEKMFHEGEDKNIDGVLRDDEIDDYYGSGTYEDDMRLSSAMRELDLDDCAYSITAEEYASYMLALDSNGDCIVSIEEAANPDFEKVKKDAERYYQEYLNK